MNYFNICVMHHYSLQFDARNYSLHLSLFCFNSLERLMLNKDCMVKRQETKNYIATVKT